MNTDRIVTAACSDCPWWGQRRLLAPRRPCPACGRDTVCRLVFDPAHPVPAPAARGSPHFRLVDDLGHDPENESS